MKIRHDRRTRNLWTTSLALLLVLSAGVLAAPGSARAESRIVATGEFEGRSDHTVSGGVTVIETDSGYVVLLEKDFYLDGAPDPKLGFGSDGYQASSLFSELRADRGLQAYEVTGDVGGFNELWVWCEKFDVPLGVARLTRSDH